MKSIRHTLFAILGFTLLAVLPGCLHLEQKLTISAEGAIALFWRLGFETKFLALSAKPEQDEEWTAQMTRPMVRGWVEEEESLTWYSFEAKLPTLALYQTFRREFVDAMRKRRADDPAYLFPPLLEKTDAGWKMVVHAPQTDGATDLTAELAKEGVWRCELEVEGQVLSHDADRIEEGVLVWESPMGEVMRDGQRATAVIKLPVRPPWAILGFFAILMGVSVVGIVVGILRKRES